MTESHPLVCSFSLQELWHMRQAGRLYCSLYPFFPSLSHNLHYPMLITHLDSPTFLPALLSYRAGIRSMDKTRKDNSSFNGLVLFLLSYYLVHKFHLKKCPDMGRSRCHETGYDRSYCTERCNVLVCTKKLVQWEPVRVKRS